MTPFGAHPPSQPGCRSLGSTARRISEGGGILPRPPCPTSATSKSRLLRRGVTLFENMLFIAVALSITMAGLTYFQQSSEADRTMLAVRQLANLTSQVRSIYATRPDFSDLAADVIVSAGAAEAGSINGMGNGLTSPWGPIFLAPSIADPRSFVVTLRDVPVTACTRLGPYSSSGRGVVADNVMNFEVAGPDGAFVSADTEVRAGGPTDGVSPSEAAETCGVWQGSVTTVRWTFAK